MGNGLETLTTILPAQRVKYNEPMAKHTTFRIGGPADALVLPENVDQLRSVLRLCREEGFPYLVIGNGSNLLVRDKGIRGVVVKLGGVMNEYRVHGTKIEAGAGILLSAMISLITASLGFIFAKPILTLTGAESTYIGDAVTYFRYIMYGIPFQALNLTINAAQRGCGKTKISMTTNVISNLVNIMFDYLLINGIWLFPRWGIKGAAIATSLGAFAAFCISLRTLLGRNGYLSFHYKTSWKLNKEVFSPSTRSAEVPLWNRYSCGLVFWPMQQLWQDSVPMPMRHTRSA
jgi:hypothetical protein